MKALYLDCIGGAAGDMICGALADLGVGLETFEQALGQLGVPGIHLHLARESRHAIEGSRFLVHAHDGGGHAHPAGEIHEHAHTHDHHEHHGRTWREIREMLRASALPPTVRDRAEAIFGRIARAEGKIHGLPVEDVHFHEVGALDSIADIVCASAGLEALGAERVFVSPLEEGRGWVDCAHGRFPVPAPATLEILRGIPLREAPETTEMITPTGAAILAEWAEAFGPMPPMVVERIGYGVGGRDPTTRPNVVRAVWGELVMERDRSDGLELDEAVCLEANLDDCAGELLGAALERVMGAGALDAWFTPIQMKKNRPGVLFSVLCPPERQEEFARILLLETSTFGVRVSRVMRHKLAREMAEVQTAFGKVAVKLGKMDGKVVRATPEYESCRALALAAQVPTIEVYRAALAASETARRA